MQKGQLIVAGPSALYKLLLLLNGEAVAATAGT